MIYLIHGENNYASWKEYKSLLADLQKKNPATKVEYFDDEQEIVANSNFGSYGMFSTKRIVVLKRFFDLPLNFRERTFEALESESDSEIIIWQDGPVDKRTKIYKSIKKKFVEREFKLLKYAELTRWIEKEAKSMNLNLDRNLLNEIEFRFGSNQLIIENELRKLQIAAESKAKIDNYDLLSPSTDLKIWEFIDAFFSRKKSTSIKILDSMNLDNGEGFSIVGAIASELRILFLLSQSSSEIIASEMKIHPFRLKKAQTFLRNLNVATLKKIYAMLSNLDFAFKKGELDARIGLTLMIAAV